MYVFEVLILPPPLSPAAGGVKSSSSWSAASAATQRWPAPPWQRLKGRQPHRRPMWTARQDCGNKEETESSNRDVGYYFGSSTWHHTSNCMTKFGGWGGGVTHISPPTESPFLLGYVTKTHRGHFPDEGFGLSSVEETLGHTRQGAGILSIMLSC